MSRAVESIASAHVLLLLVLAAAWSRPLAKLTLHPYSPTWVGRCPAFVLYAGFWTYAAWLLIWAGWLLGSRGSAPPAAFLAFGLDGVAITVLLVLAARHHRAPATWKAADYDRFMAADSPRWWRREQARRRRQDPRPEDFERMHQLEDAILGPVEVRRVKRPRRRATAPAGRAHRPR